MSYPSYHHGGRYPADEHPPPWAMGAGYHPDGGDYYHHGEPGDFHVGQGLSQKVYDAGGKPHWAVKTKKGVQKIVPFNPKRYQIARSRGVNFPNYSGRFKDETGKNVYIHQNIPKQLMNAREHAEYVLDRRPDSHYRQPGQKREHPRNQKGRQRGQQQNQKKKKSKNGKVDSHLIRVLEKIKLEVDKSKKDAKQFPDLAALKDPSFDDFKTAFTAFRKSFDDFLHDFVGRNPAKTWPKDLQNWNFPNPGDDVEAAYREFNQHVSRLKRGIAQLINSTKNYKNSIRESSILAQAIARENGMSGDNLNLETVVSALAHKDKDLKLHSPEHIFAVLPKVLVTHNYGRLGTTTQDLLADIVKEPRLVDERTYGLLIANNFKLLTKVLKSTKRRHKDEMNPPDGGSAAPPRASASSAGSAGRGKLVTEFPGLVGMSGDHVY